MILTLMSWALSVAGVSIAVVGAIAAVVLILYLRLPAVWLIVVGAIAAGWFYSGVVYQTGESACEARVKAAVDRERAEITLGLSNVTAASTKVDAANDQNEASYGKTVDALSVDAAARPAADRCDVSVDDARRLQ
jgi:hypothetical protein